MKDYEIEEYSRLKKALIDYNAALESFKEAFDKVDAGIAKNYIENKIVYLEILIEETRYQLDWLINDEKTA